MESLSGRSSPSLHYLPGGQISYQAKPMTSMNTALPYPYCTLRPEARHFLGYTPPTPSHHQEVRLFPSPAQRSAMYSANWESAMDTASDDEDATYVPIVSKLRPSQRVSNYLEELTNSPEMEQVEAETKKIRADAAAILLKLKSEPKLPASKLYTTYDFSKVYKSPTRLEASSPNDYYGFDADEEHYRIRKAPPRKPYLYQPAAKAAHNFNPYDFILDPVARVAADLPSDHYRYGNGLYDSETSPRRSYEPSSYMSTYHPPYQPTHTYQAASSSRDREYTPRPKYRFDSDASDEVRNNIAIRAQYASNRAAASIGTRKANEYLMP